MADDDNARVYSKMYSQIKDAPRLEPGREVGGTWIEKNSHTYLCDKCGFEQDIWFNLSEYRYCPRCGVEMEWVDRGYIPIELAEIGRRC